MITFADYLKKHNVEAGLAGILLLLSGVMHDAARALQLGQEGYVGTQNIYGENQLKLDVLTNSLFTEALSTAL